MELRAKIMNAAEQVIRDNGLARSTTKEIARIAGCSEGSLYNNFENKEDLFFQVMRNQLKGLMQVLRELPGRCGKGTVRGNLETVANAALADYFQSMTFMASVFSEPGILQRHRQGFNLRNEGPHRANEALEQYLLEEQRLGRFPRQFHAKAVAHMLLGSCFQHAFQMNFLGKPLDDPDRETFIEPILDTWLT